MQIPQLHLKSAGFEFLPGNPGMKTVRSHPGSSDTLEFESIHRTISKIFVDSLIEDVSLYLELTMNMLHKETSDQSQLATLKTQLLLAYCTDSGFETWMQNASTVKKILTPIKKKKNLFPAYIVEECPSRTHSRDRKSFSNSETLSQALNCTWLSRHKTCTERVFK